ncbi:hypothetical protein BDW59DRAFT_46945 [Aspergillus cavernicola]|uniref:Uncharacterized protein n=1 Tax=Aspergillus cavernicola TaxID=176166 RepID=A0ABR4J3M1_9EURO
MVVSDPFTVSPEYDMTCCISCLADRGCSVNASSSVPVHNSGRSRSICSVHCAWLSGCSVGIRYSDVPVLVSDIPRISRCPHVVRPIHSIGGRNPQSLPFEPLGVGRYLDPSHRRNQGCSISFVILDYRHASRSRTWPRLRLLRRGHRATPHEG